MLNSIRHSSASWRGHLFEFVKGFLLTILLIPTFGAPLLGAKGIDAFRFLFPIAVVSGLLYMTRLRVILWVFIVVACSLILVVIYTPLVPSMVHFLIEDEPLEKADAIVVLGTYVSDSGYLSNEGMNRLLRGIELAHQGYASTIITAAYAVGTPTPELDRANLSPLLAGITLVTAASCENTFDESQAVIEYLRKSGSKRVLLVTSPLHTRRSKAVFMRAGVPVRVSACPPRDNSLSRLDERRYRWGVFWGCLYETLGLLLYRSQGMI
jgi:uncharacterized SAM-binding protein YcdF (DUF218 family)